GSCCFEEKSSVCLSHYRGVLCSCVYVRSSLSSSEEGSHSANASSDQCAKQQFELSSVQSDLKGKSDDKYSPAVSHDDLVVNTFSFTFLSFLSLSTPSRERMKMK